jgi:hypothetical protein
VGAGLYRTAVLVPRGTQLPLHAPTVRATPIGRLACHVEFLPSTDRDASSSVTASDFFGATSTFRGLEAHDIALAIADGRIVGTLGAWDQRAFRQTRVVDYDARIALARPLYNAWSLVRGAPRLPRRGSIVCARSCAVPVVAGDDDDVFRALIAFSLARTRELLLVGLPARSADPRHRVFRPALWYTTRLFRGRELKSGTAATRARRARVPYLELGACESRMSRTGGIATSTSLGAPKREHSSLCGGIRSVQRDAAFGAI